MCKNSNYDKSLILNYIYFGSSYYDVHFRLPREEKQRRRWDGMRNIWYANAVKKIFLSNSFVVLFS